MSSVEIGCEFDLLWPLARWHYDVQYSSSSTARARGTGTGLEITKHGGLAIPIPRLGRAKPWLFIFSCVPASLLITQG